MRHATLYPFLQWLLIASLGAILALAVGRSIQHAATQSLHAVAARVEAQ